MSLEVNVKNLMATALMILAPMLTTAAPVTGCWISELPVSENSKKTVKLGLVFEGDKVTATSLCTFPDGRETNVSVTVPVRVTISEIEFLGSASKQIGTGDEACGATLRPSRINYSSSPEKLVMFVDGEQDFVEFGVWASPITQTPLEQLWGNVAP